MWYALMIFSGGLLSTGHCLGMCGGFVTLLGASGRGAQGTAITTTAFWLRQLVYHAGRIANYTVLGFWAGLVGHNLMTRVPGLRTPALLLIGCSLVATGAVSGGWLRPMLRHLASWRTVLVGVKSDAPSRGMLTALACRSAGAYRQLLDESRWELVFMAGFLNGWIPCGLVYSYVAVAAASGSALLGAATMLLFGLGTLPGLLLVAGGIERLSVALRHRLVQAAAVMVVAMGGLSLAQAFHASPATRADCPICHTAEAVGGVR